MPAWQPHPPPLMMFPSFLSGRTKPRHPRTSSGAAGQANLDWAGLPGAAPPSASDALPDALAVLESLLTAAATQSAQTTSPSAWWVPGPSAWSSTWMACTGVRQRPR